MGWGTRRGRSVVVALALLALVGCESRERSRAEGVDAPDDRGVLDRGRAAPPDAGMPPDAMPPDARPVDAMAVDAMAVDAMAVDAMAVDAMAVDAAPRDAAADASPADAGPPDRARHHPLSAHDGRSGCPRALRWVPGGPLRRHWVITATIGHHGEPLGARWLRGGVEPETGHFADEYPAPDAGPVRMVVPTPLVFGVWSDGAALRDGFFEGGAWLPGLAEDPAPIAEAFGAALSGRLSRLVLYPHADGVAVAIDHGAAARPEVRRFDGGRPTMARLAVTEGGYVVGWSSGDLVHLRFVDADGEVRAIRVPVASAAFDMALDGERLALAHIADDPRLEGRPYAAGYGRPSLTTMDLGGVVERTLSLHPEAIRGGSPAVGARADGWLVAWSRLRVDGDRNRSEIEVARVDADGARRPRRITRAHGFSFCPTVGGALGEDSLVAWMDTAEGREQIRYALGDFDGWPDDVIPEPAPAPPDFPDGCDLAVDAVPGFIDLFDAIPDGGGFQAVWRSPDGVFVGRVEPEGGARPEWVLAADGLEVDGLRIVRDRDGLMVFASHRGDVSAWRTAEPAGDLPRPLMPLARLLDGPLHDASGGPAGVAVIHGDPPTLSRFTGGQQAVALPVDARDPRVLATDRGFVLAWMRALDDRQTPTEANWTSLAADGEWDLAGTGSTRVGGYAEPASVDLWPDPAGWALVFDAHRGRPYARAVLGLRAGDPGPTRFDLDPASSTRPVAFDGHVLWHEERPIDRHQVHFAPAGGGPVERIPLPGPDRARFFLDVVDGDPVVLWTAGVQARVARFPARCRLPAASMP